MTRARSAIDRERHAQIIDIPIGAVRHLCGALGRIAVRLDRATDDGFNFCEIAGFQFSEGVVSVERQLEDLLHAFAIFIGATCIRHQARKAEDVLLQ